MIFADSHCHLDRYQPESLPEVLAQARRKGVGIFVSVGKTLQSSEGVLLLARSHEGVRGLVGIEARRNAQDRKPSAKPGK